MTKRFVLAFVLFGALSIAHAADVNREGYEIEMKASTLTSDGLPDLQRRATQGDVVAQTTLGWAYFVGKGMIDGRNIPRDNQKVLQWTLTAAEKGFPVAQNNLALLYQNGIAVKMDFHKAQHYFQLAADQGYLAAQVNLFKVNALLTGGVDLEQVKKTHALVQQQMGPLQ